jgi:hypothetical protein
VAGAAGWISSLGPIHPERLSSNSGRGRLKKQQQVPPLAAVVGELGSRDCQEQLIRVSRRTRPATSGRQGASPSAAMAASNRVVRDSLGTLDEPPPVAQSINRF